MVSARLCDCYSIVSELKASPSMRNAISLRASELLTVQKKNRDSAPPISLITVSQLVTSHRNTRFLALFRTVGTLFHKIITDCRGTSEVAWRNGWTRRQGVLTRSLPSAFASGRRHKKSSIPRGSFGSFAHSPHKALQSAPSHGGTAPTRIRACGHSCACLLRIQLPPCKRPRKTILEHASARMPRGSACVKLACVA